MPKSRSQLARESNRAYFCDPKKASEAGKLAHGIPKGRRDINYIIRALSTHLRHQGYELPYKEDPVAGAIIYKALSIGLRDNDTDPVIYCPICRKRYAVPLTAKCPVHQDGVDIPVRMPEVAMEKNSLVALGKIIDKVYPNLASIGGSVNINTTITTVGAQLVEIVVRHVPPERRMEAMKDVDDYLRSVRNLREPTTVESD